MTYGLVIGLTIIATLAAVGYVQRRDVDTAPPHTTPKTPSGRHGGDSMSTEREKKVAALAEQVGGTLDDPSARLQDPAMTAGSVATRRTGPMIEEGLPLHRTEAGWPNCATCEGGGCLDCTDPS